MCASHRPSGESDAPLKSVLRRGLNDRLSIIGLVRLPPHDLRGARAAKELHRKHAAPVITPGQRVKMTERRGRLGLLLAPIRRNRPQARRR